MEKGKMSDQASNIIKVTIHEMIQETISDENIRHLANKHQEKVHYIPVRYRILGGILQGLNIKFGNFIENLMGNLVEIDPEVQVMEETCKKMTLYFTPQTDALIDKYITDRQLPQSPDDCTALFDQLLRNILEVELAATDDERQGIVKDVDSLFRTKDGMVVYTELKYNDDHDTGKFVDINRKFIKTWAGLAVRLHIQDTKELFPILYYFNPTKRYGPIYTPSRNIMRGPQLFDRFLHTKYSEVQEYLSEIGEDPEILAMFDTVYNHVRSGPISTVRRGGEVKKKGGLE
jgi:hypothetical protein